MCSYENIENCEDGWDCVYGGGLEKHRRTKDLWRLIMAGGGSHAWHYEIYDDGSIGIWRFGCGVSIQHNKKLIEHMEVCDRVKLVNKSYECQEDESEYYETLIDCDMFQDDDIDYETDEDEEDEDEDNNINSLMEFLVMNNITEITINDESLQELRDERQELYNKLNEAKQEHIDLVSELNKLKTECDE